MMGCRISFFIFGTLSLPIMLNTEWILNLWLTKVPEWTVIFCQLAVLRILLEQLTFGLTTSILAYGHIRGYNIYRSIANVLPLIIIPILFYYNYAPYWMYIIWMICWSCIGGGILLIFCNRLVNLSIKTYSKTVLLPCLINWIIIYYIGHQALLLNKHTIYIIAISLACVIVYILISWFSNFNNREREIVSQLLKNKIKKS